jgi:hypothetical protein
MSKTFAAHDAPGCRLSGVSPGCEDADGGFFSMVVIVFTEIISIFKMKSARKSA